MGPARASLFGVLCVGAGIAAYLALAWYIEATSHTVRFKLAFYLSTLSFAVLFAMALRLAWSHWKGWSVPLAVVAMVATDFGLYLLYFLPFP
jgi:hypothetical protein